MKYIRTKYGTIEENNPDIEREILAQADTIKELCDDFIIDANYKDKPYLYDRDEPVNSPEFDNKDEVVYGAIWVRWKRGEPILKPVAKLNEKGEFELLWNGKQ